MTSICIHTDSKFIGTEKLTIDDLKVTVTIEAFKRYLHVSITNCQKKKFHKIRIILFLLDDISFSTRVRLHKE